MTGSDKDNVVNPSANDNSGAGTTSSPSGSSQGTADPKGSAGSGKKIPVSGNEEGQKAPVGANAPEGADKAWKAAAEKTAKAEAGAKAEAEAAAEALGADVVEEAEQVVADAETKLVNESEAVAQAKAEAAEWKDKYMRLHAEWDTYRRRTAEQREQEKVRAAEKLVESLIPVIDDFERTIDYANNNGETGLLGGVEAVHSKLINVLEKDGVEVINPEGEAYNALDAQAVGTVDDPSVPDETVAQVYQKGYRLGTKVLRPAMVTVTTGGPKRETPAEGE